jgi:hypothetical protein
MAILKDPNSAPSATPADPIREAGWPKGMNNVQPATALPDGFVRDAVNVDIDDAGNIRRRRGCTQRYSGAGIRSFKAFAGFGALFAEGSSLKHWNADFTATTIVPDISSTNDVSYIEINRYIYWSDLVHTGRISMATGVNEEWGIPMASPPEVSPLAIGGMDEGTYQVAATFVMSNGEEGGCAITNTVNVPANGGIYCYNLPAVAPSPNVVSIRIWVTSANGDIEYLHSTVPIGTISTSIYRSSTDGRTIKTYNMYPFPAASCLAYYKGHALGAVDNLVVFSYPLQYRLYDPRQNFFPFPSKVRLIATQPDGVFVSDQYNTYWLFEMASKYLSKDGTLLANYGSVVKLPYPAIPGTLVSLPDSTDVAWMTTRGWVRASEGGKIANLMEANVLPTVAYDVGAGIYREYNGIKQLVSAVRGGSQGSTLRATDYAEAEVIRASGL